MVTLKAEEAFKEEAISRADLFCVASNRLFVLAHDPGNSKLAGTNQAGKVMVDVQSFSTPQEKKYLPVRNILHGLDNACLRELVGQCALLANIEKGKIMLRVYDWSSQVVSSLSLNSTINEDEGSRKVDNKKPMCKICKYLL